MNNFNNNIILYYYILKYINNVIIIVIIIEIGCTGPCVGFQENAKASKQCKDTMSVLYSTKYVNERFEKENSQGRSPNYSVRVLWVLAAYYLVPEPYYLYNRKL